MATPTAEATPPEIIDAGRPSPDFVRAVAELLETDAADLLSELGYVPSEAVAAEPARKAE